MPAFIPLDPDAIEQRFFTCLLAGRPGKFKTRSLLTLPSHFYPHALIDVDGKASNLPDIVQAVRTGKIDVYAPKSPLLSKSDRTQRAGDSYRAVNQPAGFPEVTQILNFVQGLDTEKPSRVYQSTSIDSLSRLVEHVKRSATFAQKKTGADLSGFHWSKFSDMLEEFLDPIIRNASLHVFMTCHVIEREVIVPGSNTVETQWKIPIPGKMQEMLMSYFNEAYYLYDVDAGGGKQGFRMKTRSPCVELDARTAIPGLPHVMETNLKPVIEMWETALASGTLAEKAKPISGKE